MPTIEFPYAHAQTQSLEFDQTGRRFITTGNDKMVKIWDTKNFKIRYSYLYDELVEYACFARDNDAIYILQDSFVRCQKIYPRKLLFELKNPAFVYKAVPLKNDSLLLAIGDNNCFLWNTISKKLIKVIPGAVAAHLTNFFSSKTARLVTIATDGNHITVWNLLNLRKKFVFKKKGVRFHSASISSDGKRVLLGTDKGKTILWNLITGKHQMFLQGAPHNSESVSSVGFFEGDTKFWAYSESSLSKGRTEYRLCAWDIQFPENKLLDSNEYGQLDPEMIFITSFDGRFSLVDRWGGINLCRLSPDKRYLLTFYRDGGYTKSIIQSPVKDSIVFVSGYLPSLIYDYDFDETNGLISVSTRKGDIYFLDLNSYSSHLFTALGPPIRTYFMSGGSKVMTYRPYDLGNKKVWNWKKRKVDTTFQFIDPHDGVIDLQTFHLVGSEKSKNGNYCVFVYENGSFEVYRDSSKTKLLTSHKLNSASFEMPVISDTVKVTQPQEYDTVPSTGERVKNILTIKPIKKPATYNINYSDIPVRFNNSGQLFALNPYSTTYFWQTDPVKPDRFYEGEIRNGSFAVFSQNDSLVTLIKEDTVIVYDYSKRTVIFKKYTGCEIKAAGFFPGSEFLGIDDGTQILTAYDLTSGKSATFHLTSPSYQFHTSPGRSNLFYLLHPDASVQVLNLDRKGVENISPSQFRQRLDTSSFSGKKLFFVDNSEARNHFKVITQNGSLVTWYIPDAVRVNNDIFLLNNYYNVSPDVIKELSWKLNDKVFDFDQWDLHYNRPDKVLTALGNHDTALIESYWLAYLKRVRKMKADTLQFRDDFKIPELEVQNADSLEYYDQNKSSVPISLRAYDFDSSNYIQSIHVTINGNPVFGTSGLDIGARRKRDTSLQMHLEIKEGLNRVEIYCINNRSAKSYRQSLMVMCKPSKPMVSHTWFIGIGVSNYQDTNYHLRFPEKNILQLDSFFTEGGRALNTHHILLLGDKATREHIRKIKDSLRNNVRAGDKVILALSGHGTIDQKSLDKQFYFATWDMNFKNKSIRGVSYDDIFWLLDSIQAQNKLILIDACRSGEFDPDAEKDGGKSFNLQQQAFINLSRGNGATIIAATAGNKDSYEPEKLGNSIFIHFVLKGLTKGDEIKISELQDYVNKEVSAYSGEIQKPSTRQFNENNDWTIKKIIKEP